ncbi:Chloroplastic group IIA intron splicing facilitator CRS1 [Quillaja saponaria]|uniref:Chloroplastic group IIA intron splicing facilitator CRS1 n=1 Tax=Quillaja saponaria TaxID=32244 RepID=A0AAD7Q440_QUISA|nr:Chloroplastic group IIA intron splicing facilitator CRS1 [Quillaja saponaria]
MLLPSTKFHSFSLPPKPLLGRPPSPLFFFSEPLSKTLIVKTPKVPKFLVRSSVADTKTLPKSAIQRIAEKLRSLGFTEENPEKNIDSQPVRSDSAGQIFVPLPKQLPKHRVGSTIDPSWSTPENPVPQPGTGTALVRYNELTSEVNKQKKLEKELGKNKREEKVPTLAELRLPEEELRRLRSIGIKLRQKLKIGKAGITEGIVNGIHERWRHSEIVKIVCEDICRLNMKRTHDLLERKTGGLVVWRSGSKIILYRGTDYKYPYFLSENVLTNDTPEDALRYPHSDNGGSNKVESRSPSKYGASSAGKGPATEVVKPTLLQGVGSPNKVRFQLPGEAELAEEADRLLEGLGPRFSDWWGYDPLPVDADLLPAVVTGYRRPFRLLPYGVNPKLTDDEMTTLRRLGRPLPCHFALGRNRKLQGLAAAVIKLWERCEIAKIAVKRGVQNTNSEMMAEELKQLTGGTLLSRDREFIALYRGKDFLPSAVSSAIEERRNNGIHEEKLKKDYSSSVTSTPGLKFGTLECGPEGEHKDTEKDTILSGKRKIGSAEEVVKRTNIKLLSALEKKEKAEKILAELEKSKASQKPELDKEGITEEERYMLRKIGLKMKPFLLLGRRGVFDGTVENMHLHWKYRELVKIICNERSLEAVHKIARTLEAESGGILVAVERVSKGNAIVVYRGKNYKRPTLLRPSTLLNKREAMKRSKEAQRRESLKLHVLKLTRNIDELKLQLVKDEEANCKQKDDESGVELARDKHGAHSTLVNLNIDMEASVSRQQGKLLELHDDDGAGKVVSDCSSGLVSRENLVNAFVDMTSEAKTVTKSWPDDCTSDGPTIPVVVDAERSVSDEAMESSVISSKVETEPSAPVMVENGSNNLPSRSVHLSNKERLLLRKQALNMRKRPVLAVGKSNIVTGVAKTIKTHFQKHPFAIVNVKGRAKGTSVQEVVFKLEQATGAVLVSQEPSKVILYRGWGAGERPRLTENNAGDIDKNGKAKPSVSSELLAAIRLECGLQ